MVIVLGNKYKSPVIFLKNHHMLSFYLKFDDFRFEDFKFGIYGKFENLGIFFIFCFIYNAFRVFFASNMGKLHKNILTFNNNPAKIYI